MGLFNRKNKGKSEDGTSEKKAGWKRPANTAFKQQRLKAWQPILTPKTVLPTLFGISIVFAPIGALLIWGSGLVSEMTIDYTNCERQTSSSLDSPTFTRVPNYSYNLRASDSKASYEPPTFAYVNNTDREGFNETNQFQCLIQFDVPADFQAPVFLYYKLSNFYQNHRRYSKSLNSDQLKGDAKSADDLNDSDCKPLGSIDGKAVYPCGLIANSVFNDTFSILTTSDNSSTYTFSEKGIAWPGEARKYVDRAGSDYRLDQIVPPPNWKKRYPDGYTEENFPNLRSDEHFQNWMRTAGLPTFTKLWGRNDGEDLPRGRYSITIDMNFPVLPYKGTKSIVISTVSWIGGKNPFLGWAYVGASALFMLLAILGTIRHVVKPRRLGDMSLLSWNR
ncbi:transcription regulator [Pterulicium gracile]|uniref:Transcription regulator n=1 Tax=Pterulicium gracile TaxID=1884261 RepID=A0A5C3QBT2_9AGAR|nr:transcription regulator [Pterula gracilis]